MPFGFCSVGTVDFGMLCDCYNPHFEGMQLLILGGLFMSGHFSENVAVLQNMHLSPTLIILAKATLAFPFCFHFVNGIRHLVSVIFLSASNLLSYGIPK